MRTSSTSLSSQISISDTIAEAKITGQSEFTTPTWEGKPCRVTIRVVDIPEEQAELKRKTVKDIFERNFAEWFREEYLPDLTEKGNPECQKTSLIPAR